MRNILFGVLALVVAYEGYKYMDKRNKLIEADKIIEVQKKKTVDLTKKVQKRTIRQGREETCKIIEKLAREVMTQRQDGRSMSDMMGSMGEERVTREMVLLAYKKPRYGTDEYIQKSITDFANKTASICYSSIK